MYAKITVNPSLKEYNERWRVAVKFFNSRAGYLNLELYTIMTFSNRSILSSQNCKVLGLK